MMGLVDLLLCLIALPTLVATGYLCLLAVLSIRRPALVPPPLRKRFDLVVPAHNEALGIARTVRALAELDYPAELFRILVVADNCEDDTAGQASGAGAEVLVRNNAELRGKGYALEFAFQRSLDEGRSDAVVVIDADTVPSRNLLQAFSARLERGAHAMQAHYGVLNPGASWRTRLMAIALGMFHRARSLGRETLRVSCGLRGNGMCFSHALIRQVPHQAFSLVEDLEYGIRIGRAGHRVHYAWEAEVLGEMVSSEKASRSQRRRWEGGRLAMARNQGWPLVRDAVVQRSRLLADLAMDVLVPPLSYVALATAGVTLAAAALSAWSGTWPVSLWLGLASVWCLAVYVLRGWQLSEVGARGLLDLAWAPVYVVWKLWLVVRGSKSRSGEWVRTTREAEDKPPPGG